MFFKDTVPYALKIPRYPGEVDSEFTWSEQIDSPYIIKYIAKVEIPGDRKGLVMKAYVRSVEDLIRAWQTKFKKKETAPPIELEDMCTLSEQAVANVFLTVVKALQYLNGKRICFSDIKPANILIGADGKMVLCDFGAVVYYGDEIMEATTSYCLFDVENCIEDYGKKGCLKMDLVCLATTLMAMTTYPLNSPRFSIFRSRVLEYKERGNFAGCLAHLCLCSDNIAEFWKQEVS